MKKTLTLITFSNCLLLGAPAHDWTASRPDGHAPISIMADHVHGKGEWMISYRYMFMNMDGMMNGTSDVSSADVFAANYTVTPEKMTMQMHMPGLMYAITDDITLTAMIPYKISSMDHRIFPGALPLIALNGGSDTFTTKTSGIGDLKLGGLFQFFDKEERTAHVGMGLSLPTGSIREQDVVPGPGGRIDRQLPAPMQLGSGTVDLLPSITYLEQYDSWSWGAQSHGVLRTYENYHDYHLGSSFDATSWAAWKIARWVSFAGRGAYRWQGEMSGQQSDLSLNLPFAPNRLTVPTAFSTNYGGQSISIGGGFNFMIPKGVLKGLRFAADVMVPVWQDLNGYQLGTDYVVTGGIQYAW